LVKPDEIAPDFNQKTKPPEAHFPGSTVVTHQTVWVAEMQVSLCDEFVTLSGPRVSLLPQKAIGAARFASLTLAGLEELP
jgi:hypothetical protein